MKVTYKDINDYLSLKNMEKQTRLKVKYRRNRLNEKKYSLDRTSLSTYLQGRIQ